MIDTQHVLLTNKPGCDELITKLQSGKYEKSRLWLNAFSHIDYEAWQAVLSALNNNPMTYSLSICGYSSKKLTHDCFQALSEMLKTNKTIKHLHVEHHDITPEQIDLLSSGIVANTTLHKLSLNNFNLGDVGISTLLVGIASNHTLQSLCFNQNNITAEAVPSCIQFLDSHSKIISLDMQQNDIGDPGAELFADFIKRNKSLLELNIAQNALTNIGDGKFHLAFKFYQGPIVRFCHSLSVNNKVPRDDSLRVTAHNPSLLECSALDVDYSWRISLVETCVQRWIDRRKYADTLLYNNFPAADFPLFFSRANAIKFKLSKGAYSHLVPQFYEELCTAYSKAENVPSVVEFYCCTMEIPQEMAEMLLKWIAAVTPTITEKTI